MSNQRKFLLLFAALGFISMFLPWVSISMFGFNKSVNGMHDKGVIVFFCFVAAGVIACLGDHSKNLDKNYRAINLMFGALAFAMIVWFYSQASDNFMGLSLVGYGLYVAGTAVIGILASTIIIPPPADNTNSSEPTESPVN